MQSRGVTDDGARRSSRRESWLAGWQAAPLPRALAQRSQRLLLRGTTWGR